MEGPKVSNGEYVEDLLATEAQKSHWYTRSFNVTVEFVSMNPTELNTEDISELIFNQLEGWLSEDYLYVNRVRMHTSPETDTFSGAGQFDRVTRIPSELSEEQEKNLLDLYAKAKRIAEKIRITREEGV